MLQETGEAEAVRRKHRDYFFNFARECNRARMGSDRLAAFQQFEAEHDNLRAALDGAQEDPQSAELGMDLCGALYGFWMNRGYIPEGRRRFDAALAHPGAREPSRKRAGRLHLAAELAILQGDFEAGRLGCEQSLEIARAHEDRSLIA